MMLRRDEVVTGALVIGALAVLVTLILALGAPGLFRSLKTYHIVFDNAAGIQTGTQVYLAGRRVGQVTRLQSPVPIDRRPVEHRDYEALIEVQVRTDARIYRQVTVRMMQYGWFGTQIIDFVQGDEQSGLAPSGMTFVGNRGYGFTELAAEANAVLQEVTETLGDLQELTGEEGDLRKTVANAREFSETIKEQPWRLIWRSKKDRPEESDEKAQRRERKEKEADAAGGGSDTRARSGL